MVWAICGRMPLTMQSAPISRVSTTSRGSTVKSWRNTGSVVAWRAALRSATDPAKNTALLPSEILKGPTIGVAATIPRVTDKIGLRFSLDLMVIGDRLHYADVFSALQTVESELARTVNPNVMSITEWRRKHKQTGFVARIAE